MGTLNPRTLSASSPSVASDEGVGFRVFVALRAMSYRTSTWACRQVMRLTAQLAASLLSMGVGVLGRVLMACRAMGARPSNCGCCILPALRSQAAPRVLLRRDRLNMIWINASSMGAAVADLAGISLMASVIERQSFWYRSFEKLVRKAMGPVSAKYRISAFCDGSSPLPATVLQLPDVTKKQLSDIARLRPRASALALLGAKTLRLFAGFEFNSARFALSDILGCSHVTPFKSHRSGLARHSNATAARLYFSKVTA